MPVDAGVSNVKPRYRVCANEFKTSAGRPDRPALEEDTLAQNKSDMNSQKSKL